MVIPSMPGYGFSGRPTSAGWDPCASVGLRGADEAPGYDAVRGAGRRLGRGRRRSDGRRPRRPAAAESAPPELVGIHTNFPALFRPDLFAAVLSPAARRRPALDDEETRIYEQLQHVLCDSTWHTPR